MSTRVQRGKMTRGPIDPRSDLEDLGAILWEAQDPEGPFSLVEGASEEILGCSPGAWLTDPAFWKDRLHPDDREWVLEACRAAVSAGRSYTHEYRMVAADGRAVWVRDVVRVAGRGARRRFRGLITDITERKRLQESLQVSEQRYWALFENANDIVFTIDLEGNFTSVNKAAERITGYEQGAGPMNFGAIIAPEHLGRAREMMARRLRGQAPATYEIEVLTRDGRRVSLELSNHLLYRDGKPVGVQGIARDTTERRRADAALQQASQTLKAVIDASPLATFSLDLNGHVQMWNAAAERMFGWSEREVLHSAPPLIEPGEEEAFRAWMQRTAAGETMSGFELRRKRRDGSTLELTAWTALLHGTSGAVDGMVVILDDVTERKKLEVQFRHAQKMEAVGRLAGGVAHDFNNILTVIAGYGQLGLQSVDPNDALRKYLEEIVKAGNRAAALTRQLLAFSRKQVLQPKVIDLNHTVAATKTMLERLIGEDIKLTGLTETGLWLVKADPGQVEQVIMNLALNARDAMPEGGRLTIETANVTLDESVSQSRIEVEAGHYVMLAVSDTGVGMDAEAKAHLFEPFFTTKEAGKGTGLGLSTVYGIVRQSGGHIWVYSELGLGTTVKVYLPRAEGSLSHAEAAMPAASGVAPGGRETILIVEDDDSLRELVVDVVRQLGYNVIQAREGSEALGVALKHPGPIHLIVTDVVMPGVGGRSLALQLLETRPGTKVLYVSGYPGEAIVQQGALDAGLEFMQKPFTPFQLVTRVRAMLDAN